MKVFAHSFFILGIVLSATGAAQAQPNGAGNGPRMMGPGMMGGYGMGPGMMGPGMMGGFGMGGMMGARNQACNQDGSVPDFGFRRNSRVLNLSADDVKSYVRSSIAWNGNPNLKLGTVREASADTITATIVTKDNSLVQELAFDRRTGFSCFVDATN